MLCHPPEVKKFNLIEMLTAGDGTRTNLPQFTEYSYKKRHILFMPFHKDNLIFYVKQGRLRVYFGLRGREISLAILGPGDIYCTHTRAHVEALEDTTIMACPIDAFINPANEQNAFLAALMASVGRIITGSFSIIENLYFNCADKRVAAYFYEQALSLGKEVEEGIYVKIGLTVDNIAKIVGSSRQTVSTLISVLEKERVIRKIARGEYIVLDMRELYLLANSCSE